MDPLLIFLDVPGVLTGRQPAAAWRTEVYTPVSRQTGPPERETKEVLVSPDAVEQLDSLIGECNATTLWVSDWARDGRLTVFLEELPDVGLPVGAWLIPPARTEQRPLPASWKAEAIARFLRTTASTTRWVWMDAEGGRWSKYLRGVVALPGIVITPSPVTGITRSEIEAIRVFSRTRDFGL
jgi:hypothetical protein